MLSERLMAEARKSAARVPLGPATADASTAATLKCGMLGDRQRFDNSAAASSSTHTATMISIYAI